MTKLMITGAKGQLGQELVRCCKDLNFILFPFGKEELDIRDQQQVNIMVQKIKPDIIIHCAAFTNVDKAEIYTDLAFQINAIGTRNVAVAANKIDATVVYISTNYVFDGQCEEPYTEYDMPYPIGVYGKTKLAGENFVRELATKYFIIRTAWLFGGHGKNFVTTMQELAKKNDSLSVVDDQIGNPTYAFDLSQKIIHLIQSEKYGIYHISNSGRCNWYEFAKEIFEMSNININVTPISTEIYNAPAPRPKNAAMEALNLRLNGFNDMRNWKEGLQSYIEELKCKVN